jgi:putative acetyltransferase
MYIRRYRREDLPAVVELFHETVHEVNVRDYSDQQLEAWAPGKADLVAWDIRLSGAITYVAEQEGTILGFGVLSRGGLLDLLYVHKDHQRHGIGSGLVHAIQEHARAVSLETLQTEASITAVPFFSSLGFVAVKEQQKTHQGVLFTNTVMTKDLAGGPVRSAS